MPQRHRLSNLISGLSSSAKSSRRRHKFNRRYSFEVLENRIVLANEIFTYLNSSVFPTSAVVGFSNPLTLAADFDGNQRDDLLLVDRVSGFNRVVLNGSNGQFSSFDDYFSRSALTNLGDNHSLVSGRFHIDSPFESLLVVNRQTGHNRFYWVDGGSFNERINIFPAGMIGSLVSGASIVGGNFDGIGLDDVLVLDDSSGNNRALLNSTSVPPTLQNGFLDPEWNLGFQSSSVFAADFDGNGFADVLLVNSTSGANRLIYNQPYSTDRFINRDAELSSKTIGSLGQNYTPLAGDFDGNYLGDVVFLNRSNGHNSVFSGTIAPLSQNDDRLWSSVPVQNGSFESPSLVDGGVTAGSVNGWIIEPPTSSPAFAGIFNPNSTYHTNGTVSNGQNAVAIYNATISQSIGHTLLPNREYRLSVDIGNQLPYSTAPWRIELRSGNVVIAWADDRFISPPSGQFETAVASFVSPSNIQPELLSIRIIGGAGWVSFDNVILTQTSVINDLPVQNASFENPALADGAVTPGSVSGWVIEPPMASPAFAGIFNPSPSYHNNGKAADRLNAVTLYNASIYQANSHSLLPNREYTLRVDVGHQIPYSMAPWRIELLGGNTVLSWADQRMLTPATGSFETVVIKYVTAGDVTPMPLAIRIAGGAGWVSFDNVRLTSFSSFSGKPIGNDDNHYWTPAETVLSIPSTSSTTLTTNDYTHRPDAVTATLSAVPKNGTILNFHENGTFVYKPNAGFVGIDTFQYVASSEGRISQPITVSIGVGTTVLPRENKDAIPMSSIMGSSGFGNGFSNIPISSSAETDGVLAKTGGLLLSEDLLPGLSLVYRSDSLTRPIIEVESQFAPTSLPSTITVTSQIGNLASVTHEYSTSGFLSGDKFRLAIQHDASSLATGVYPYTVIIDDNGALAAQTLNGFIRVVNRAGSAFGDGWMLAGLDRIFSTDSGVLLVSGIGNTLWFPKIGDRFSYAEGDSNFTQVEKNANGTFTLIDKYGTRSDFNSSGLITTVQNLVGDTITYAYADRNNDGVANELVSITEPYGRVTTFAYANGRVATITDFSGKSTALQYVGNNLDNYRLTDPDGAGTHTRPLISFQYAAGALTGRSNALLQTTQFSYGTHGRLTQVTHPDDSTWNLQPSEIVGLPAGATGNTLKRPDDAIATVTDEALYIWRFRTDRFGNITESISPRGYKRTTLRNSSGLPYLHAEPDPDQNGPLSQPVSMWSYDEFDNPVLSIAPDGGITRTLFSWDTHLPTLSMDPIGRTQKFIRDKKGNPFQTVDGLGNVTNLVFNQRGLITSSTAPDPDGTGPISSPVTNFSYDALGRMTSMIYPDGGQTLFSYNTADQLIQVTDELGKTETYGYDQLGRETSVTNRINATSTILYDEMSRPVRITNARGYTTDIQYNNRGWVSSYQLPDPDGADPLPRPENILLYDSRGNLTSQRDEGGLYVGTVNYEYDDDNRLTYRSHPMYGNLKEGYVYDDIGRLTRVNRVPRDAEFTLNPNPPSNGWLDMQYDSLGRIQSKRSYEGTVLKYEETYEYNLAGELTARIDGNGNRSENVYDSRGLLVRETLPDPDGNGPQYPLSISYVYDNLGRNTSIDRGFGRVTRLEYNSRNWITKEIQPDPDGSGPLTSPATVFGYNVRGDLTTITSPMGRVTTSVYDDAQRLISRIDPDPDGVGPLLSPISTWAYNEVDWLTSSTDAVGATTTFLYDELGRTTQIHHPDPDGAGPLPSPIAIYTYDPKGLKSVFDPIGIQASYERDARGRVTEVTVPSGSKTSYEYNFYDQVTKILEPDPDNAGSKPRPWTRLKYDDHGRLFRKEDQREKVTEFGYDSFSNLTQIVDDAVPVGPNSASDTTTFQYDALNRQISETNSLGSRIYIYNVAGNLTKTVDRNNRGTSYVYDNLDRLIREEWTSTPGTFNATVVTGEDGAVRNEQQNVGWNASVSTTNVTGTFLLGFNGQYTSNLSWNADSATIQSALEALSNVGAGNVAVTVSAPTTFSRTFSITFRNARGGQNQNQVQIWTSNMVATAGTVAAFAQTLVNGVTISESQSIQIPGWSQYNQGHWTISYGNEVSPPLPPNATVADVANALNAFASLEGVTVSPGFVGHFHITFGGIHAGVNMLQVRVDTTNLRVGSPLRTITSSYNADSELMSVSDPSATINYVRDNLGRATTIQNILGTFIGQQFTFHQSFNAVDQRTELRAVHGNNNDFRNTYAYDNLRRLTQIVQTGQSGSAPVVDKRVSFEYNTQGLRSKLSRFESTSSAHPVATTDYSYDTTKRLTGIAHKQGTTNLNTYSLIYDDMHRITSITSTLDGKVDFDYDKRSQLTSVIDTTASGGYNDVSQTVAYDQRGNRTGTGYTVNSDNRLTAAPNGVGMTYDNEGNLTSVTNNGWTQKLLEWDHRNRLTRVTVGSVVVTYEYDAFNRMVKRSQSGTFNNTYFAYDEGINPLLQWESYDNRLSHRYLWSDSVDELLADEQFLAGMTAPNTKWAMSDHQGTIKDIVDYNPATGVASVDRHRKYDPFGDRRGAAAPTDIVFGYTGKYFDEVTGLQNNWNRWYDPKQGRFISQDPIGFAGGDENLYRYVGNGPTNATDPSGLETVLVALPGGVVRRIEVPDGNIGEIDNELHKIAESGSRSQESMQRAIELISLRQSIMAALDEVERARGMRPIIRGATPEEATRANAQYANQLMSEMRRIDNNPFGIHIKEDRDYLDRRLAEIPGGYKAQYDYSRAVSGLQVAASTVVGTRRQPSATISPQKPQVIPLPAPKGILSGNVTVKEAKWDYFFGRVTSNPHNQARSLQNLKDLKTLGFEDNAVGRLGLTKLFEIGRHSPEISRHTTQFGVTITRRIPAGDRGIIEAKYFYPRGDMSCVPEISTIIPKIFP